MAGRGAAVTGQMGQGSRRLQADIVREVAATLMSKVDGRPRERCPRCDRRLTDRHHCDFFYE